MRRPAFTLIEMLACLLLVGLLGSITVVSLAAVGRTATRSDALDTIQAMDARVRGFARRHGQPAGLVIDLSDQTIRAQLGNGTDAEAGARLGIAEPLRLDVVWVGDERYERGEVRIDCSTAGWTPDYAIGLATDSNGPVYWLLIAGATGQTQRLETERGDFDAWAALLRSDAD